MLLWWLKEWIACHGTAQFFVSFSLFVFQILTYRDFLPRIIGPGSMEKFLPAYTGFDEKVDPGISNVFATAAFRFGHLMIQPFMFRLDEKYTAHEKYPTTLLHKSFFTPWRVVFEGKAKNCSLWYIHHYWSRILVNLVLQWRNVDKEVKVNINVLTYRTMAVSARILICLNITNVWGVLFNLCIKFLWW